MQDRGFPAWRIWSARVDAIAILEEMEAVGQNKFIFPGSKQGGPISDMSTWANANSDSKLGVFVISAAQSLNVDLKSSADKVEVAYRRADLLQKRRKLMDAWDRYCTRPVSNLVVLERRA